MKIAHFTGCFPGREYLFLVCGAEVKNGFHAIFFLRSFYVVKTPAKLGNSGIHAASDTMKTGENV
jgi:hypothetical protein